MEGHRPYIMMMRARSLASLAMKAEENKAAIFAIDEGLESLKASSSSDAVESWRIEYLGSKGRLKAAMAGMKDVAREDKPAYGKRANEIKKSLEQAFELAKAAGLPILFSFCQPTTFFQFEAHDI